MMATASAAPPPQPFNLDEKAMRSAREAREAARAAKNGSNSHSRRTYSPPQSDEYHFSGEGEEARSPTSDVALQDAMLAQAQSQSQASLLDQSDFDYVQQRVVPVGQQSRNTTQRRPPVANAPVNVGRSGSRGGAPGSPTKNQPPSYPGVQLEDSPVSYENPTRRGHYRRNTGPGRASGSDPSLPSQGAPPPSGTSTRRPRSMAEDSTQQRRPFSSHEMAASAASINRINSPTIGKTVLQPLEQKMQEYNQLMEEAQREMTQLDDELRQLQERRRQAEDRFVEAKAKHDEYHRQHHDVGRALRGDLQRPTTPRPIPRMESMMSFEQRPMSEQSNKTGGKVRARDRLRMSLFKG